MQYKQNDREIQQFAHPPDVCLHHASTIFVSVSSIPKYIYPPNPMPTNHNPLTKGAVKMEYSIQYEQ